MGGAAPGRAAVGHGGRLQHLLVGPDRQVQAAARTLDLAQVLGPQFDLVIHVGRLPACDARGDGALGFPEPAVQPRSRTEQCPGEEVSHHSPSPISASAREANAIVAGTVSALVCDERAPGSRSSRARSPAG